MDPVENLDETKQQEIDTVVTDFNKRQQLLREKIENDIELTTLDSDERIALKQKLFPAGLPKITSPTIIVLGKTKCATNGILRSIMGEKSFIDHNMLVDIFNKDRDQLIKCESFKDENLTNFSIGFLEEAAATGMIVAVYQPFSKKVGAIGLGDFAEICKGMVSKSGGVLLNKLQFDVEKGIVNKEAWFKQNQYSEFRKNSIITPNVIRMATLAEIPGTANEKFVEQMIIVGNWMEKTFKNSMTNNLRQAIGEIRTDVQMLTKLQNNDSAKFLTTIKEYQFFKRYMETGLETFWRIISYEQATGTKLLQNMYLRGNVVEPVDAALGNSGCWDEYGPRVDWNSAYHSNWNIGLGFSCIGL